MEVGDRGLEFVEVVKYLGVMISGDGRMEEEVRSRIGKVARAIGVLNEPGWEWKELSRRSMLRACNPIVVSTLVHGSEMQILNKQQESAIQATEMRVLRQIAENRMVDGVRNVEIRGKLKQEGVLEKVKKSQVRWREALNKIGPERFVSRGFKAEMEGRRGRRWPRKKWNGDFKQ